MDQNKIITLDQGGGGKEMQELLESFVPHFYRGNWENSENDAATFSVGNADLRSLQFTTDSYVVSPWRFSGGDIGHLALSGTVNDLVVMGADPVGISLALVIEEGFKRSDLEIILNSIQQLSQQYKIPVATGDTKVMERGALDGIIINTSGVGFAQKVLNDPLEAGDKIIISGGIGEHGVALLSQRFDFQTGVVSDSKPLVEEMKVIRDLIKCAKDPTRGGVAATLNEIANVQHVELEIWDEALPIQRSVRSACDMLGLDPLSLANEGKVICFTSSSNKEEVLQKLRKFNKDAAVIGEVKHNLQSSDFNLQTSNRVILKTAFGSRYLDMPKGKIVPRIC